MDTVTDDVYRHLNPEGKPRSGHPNFYQLLNELAALHDAKNQDYANAADPFANFRACEKAGIPMTDGIYTRMSDKWERITNLLAKRRQAEGPAVAGESIRDSLLDLAAYALIECVALDEATPSWQSGKIYAEPEGVKLGMDDFRRNFADA